LEIEITVDDSGLESKRGKIRTDPACPVHGWAATGAGVSRDTLKPRVRRRGRENGMVTLQESRIPNLTVSPNMR
jgi:hypothetical protein